MFHWMNLINHLFHLFAFKLQQSLAFMLAPEVTVQKKGLEWKQTVCLFWQFLSSPRCHYLLMTKGWWGSEPGELKKKRRKGRGAVVCVQKDNKTTLPELHTHTQPFTPIASSMWNIKSPQTAPGIDFFGLGVRSLMRTNPLMLCLTCPPSLRLPLKLKLRLQSELSEAL